MQAGSLLNVCGNAPVEVGRGYFINYRIVGPKKQKILHMGCRKICGFFPPELTV